MSEIQEQATDLVYEALMVGSLGDMGFHFPLGVIHFTGWKGNASTPGEVAQILWWPGMEAYQESPENHVFYYVNLPGMQVGRYSKGDTFDLGTATVTDEPKDELRRMFSEGLRKLIDFVLNDNPPWLASNRARMTSTWANRNDD